MLRSFQFSNEELKKIPLLVCLLGEDYMQEPVIRSKGMPYYQWFFVKKGRGEFIENGIRHVVSEGQSFFILPEMPHSYRQLSDEWVVHVVGFTGAACETLMNIIGINKSGVYYVKDQNMFPKYIHSMMHLEGTTNDTLQRKLSKEAYSFVMDMALNIHFMEHGIAEQKYSLVSKIMAYLEENFRQDLYLDMLSEYFELSKDYLCTVFKQKTNYTIIQFLNIVRISWARIYLEQYPEKNVEEIGWMCGFRSPSYFGKIFKQIVGTTPANYRKRSGVIFCSGKEKREEDETVINDT